eukprot:scaffold84486_cov19-Tisochrysis_lutea.AAC.2
MQCKTDFHKETNGQPARPALPRPMLGEALWQSGLTPGGKSPRFLADGKKITSGNYNLAAGGWGSGRSAGMCSCVVALR